MTIRRRFARSSGPNSSGPGAVRTGARGVRRVAAAVVLCWCAACGTPATLPKVEVGQVPASSPLRTVALRRVDSFATLDLVIAPQGRTALLLVDPACDRCAIALEALAGAAFAAPFSALVIGVPDLPPSVAALAEARGVDRWTVPTGTPASVAAALGLPTLPALVVVSADGDVVASAAGDDLESRLDATLAAAAACPPEEPCP